MPNRPVKTPDTCYITALTKNGYGDVTVTEQHEVACAFFDSFSQQTGSNQELTQSDAYAYLKRDDPFIVGRGYMLQGLYFKTNVFGIDRWYIITTVEVAQRKLLTNEVNNVLVNLQVATKPTGA